MERRIFFKTGCACGILSLIDASQLTGNSKTIELQDENKKNIPQVMNQEQVKRIFRFIDSFQNEEIKKCVFSQLGYECFYARKLDDWIGQYVGNIQAFFDRVNIEKKSKYWEALEFNKEHTVLKLTGKKVNGCACAFADIPQPPKSLCNYCCQNFQQQLFGTLLGKRVKVEITDSFLLGGERCSTLIHIM